MKRLSWRRAGYAAGCSGSALAKGLASASAFCLVLAVATTVASAPASSSRPAPDDRYVVLVSLDGFANFYLGDPRAHIPTLRRMIREGAVADEGLVCSFPTVTWPNHTTLVTGVPPAKHGVLGNTVFDRDKGEPVQLLIDPVFDKDEIVKVPTIYDVAHAAGLKTAAVVWPATRNARSLDWTIPDMGPQELLEKYSTAGWLDELRRAGIPYDRYGDWVKAKEGGPRRDWMATRAAIQAMQQHHVNLVLLHLIELDHAQHEFGPKGGDALWAVSSMDDRLRDLLDAIANVGLSEKTTVIVTSDHGFYATSQSIHPNVKLRQLGLVTVQEATVTAKRAWSVAQGGAASLYIMPGEDTAKVAARIKAAMRDVQGVEAVIEPKDFARIGQAAPHEDRFGADLWLAAKEGYSFSNSHAGDAVVTPNTPGGTHGYLPDPAQMRGIFIAWGRGIKPGAKLGAVHNTQVAPTIARLLGLELPAADGRPLDAMRNQARR
jgi:predicted AlkP superfamily pyrophosphatase or phosphodiesterase